MVKHCTTKLPAPSLISHFQCKSRLWFAKQYCPHDFFNSAFPCYLRLLSCCHTKEIKKKLQTWTHIMDKPCTSNFQLAGSSLTFNAKADCDMQKNTLSTRPSFNNALPCYLRLLPQCHTKEIKKKLQTWTHIMVKHCTSNFQLHRSSLTFNAKTNWNMRSNTFHATSSTTLFHAIFDRCPSAAQRK